MKSLCSSCPGVFLALQNGNLYHINDKLQTEHLLAANGPFSQYGVNPQLLSMCSTFDLSQLVILEKYHLKLNTCYN